jgi:hypothetical protein
MDSAQFESGGKLEQFFRSCHEHPLFVRGQAAQTAPRAGARPVDGWPGPVQHLCAALSGKVYEIDATVAFSSLAAAVYGGCGDDGHRKIACRGRSLLWHYTENFTFR